MSVVCVVGIGDGTLRDDEERRAFDAGERPKIPVSDKRGVVDGRVFVAPSLIG